MAHINHFLHADFQAQDAINIFAKNGSRQRLAPAQTFLAQGPHCGEACFTPFSEPPLCVADTGDICQERTVAAAVMLPAQGLLLVRPGNPAIHRTQHFSFSD